MSYSNGLIQKSLLVDSNGAPYVAGGGGGGSVDSCLGLVGLQSLSLGEVAKPSLTTEGVLYSEPLITYDIRRILSGQTVLINAMSAPTDQGPIITGNNGTGHLKPFGSGITVSFEIGTVNAADVSTGTGCRAVTVEGLDGSFNPISETILTPALTTATLVNAYNHINNIFCSDAGSGGNPAGDIPVRTVSGSVVFGQVGTSIQGCGFYKCPAGKRAVLSRISYSNATTAGQFNIIVWRKDANHLTNVARFDTNIPILDYPTVVLEEGDACYIYQNSSNGSKVLLTYQLYDV